MLKKMIKLALISSMKVPVIVHAKHQASFVTSSRYSAQIASVQFLYHGRRKQKNAYKRYLAKLRDETDAVGLNVVYDQTSLNDDPSDDSNVKPNKSRTRFRARVSYCGTPFHGWQLQPGKPTVQGEIEAALTRRFNRRIPVVGAGRTDSGVHARGQAIHFDLFPNEIPFEQPTPPDVEGETVAIMDDKERLKADIFCKELENSMNRMICLDIRMFGLQLAPYTWATSSGNEDAGDDSDGDEVEAINDNASLQIYARPWHVIQQADSKWYSYRLALGPLLWNPMERFTRTHFVHRPFVKDSSSNDYDKPYAITEQDIQRLQSIFKLYEGTHDFRAFGGQLEQNAKKRNGDKPINTIRTVYKAELVKEPNYGFGRHNPVETQHGFIGEEGNYRIDFLLKGALYKMVRNMVGTAIEVWLGRMTEEQLLELLKVEPDGERKVGRQNNPCKPAPPEGLTLECVYYDDGF